MNEELKPLAKSSSFAIQQSTTLITVRRALQCSCLNGENRGTGTELIHFTSDQQ